MDPDEYRTVQIGVSKFWAAKHAADAQKNWDAFYKRNQTNFFRDRHWTINHATDGFPCLAQHHEPPALVVEAGCGVGNTMWPLLAANPTLRIHAFDFSATAVRLVQENRAYDPGRICAFTWDFSRSPLPSVPLALRPGLRPAAASFALLIFVLSAIPPQRHVDAVRNLAATLAPAGRLLFRDYAAGDLTQLRFKRRNRISDELFVRQDHTLSYFFDEEGLRVLMKEAGLREVYVRRVHRDIENRKQGIVMQRIFLQGEFEVPDVVNLAPLDGSVHDVSDETGTHVFDENVEEPSRGTP